MKDAIIRTLEAMGRDTLENRIACAVEMHNHFAASRLALTERGEIGHFILVPEAFEDSPAAYTFATASGAYPGSAAEATHMILGPLDMAISTTERADLEALQAVLEPGGAPTAIITAGEACERAMKAAMDAMGGFVGGRMSIVPVHGASLPGIPQGAAIH